MHIKTTRELASEYCDWHGIEDRRAICDAYVCGYGTAEYAAEQLIRDLEKKIAELESALEKKNENT